MGHRSLDGGAPGEFDDAGEDPRVGEIDLANRIVGPVDDVALVETGDRHVRSHRRKRRVVQPGQEFIFKMTSHGVSPPKGESTTELTVTVMPEYGRGDGPF